MTESINVIPRNGTIPLADLVRAQVADRPVAMPVRGAVYARLSHITAVPAVSGGSGYSLSRLQAVDSLIARMASQQEALTPDVRPDPVEAQERLLEEASRRLVEEMDRTGAGSLYQEGMVLNLTA